LPYSQIARDYLIAEGVPPDQIIKIGSPMREVINYYRPKIEASDILARLSLEPEKYFLVSAHREENIDSENTIRSFITVLTALSEKYKLPVIVSTHPRSRKQIDNLGIKASKLVQFLKPFGFFDYIKLQISAKCVLSDSGTITEESSILNFPALNLREVHERPEGFEEGTVMIVGMDFKRILQALQILEDQPRGVKRVIGDVNDYLPDNISLKMVRIIQSYVDFVNKKVWKKG
jgi:UDP-N-acetylglucosamine 2-epimerase (non-hydrolysing)